MTNEQMIAGRFEKWAKCRKMHSAIVAHLRNDGRVQVTTYTRSTVYSLKHATWFTCGKTGVYVQAGKSRVDIKHCNVRLID
jgi:hypothetical protein